MDRRVRSRERAVDDLAGIFAPSVSEIEQREHQEAEERQPAEEERQGQRIVQEGAHKAEAARRQLQPAPETLEMPSPPKEDADQRREEKEPPPKPGPLGRAVALGVWVIVGAIVVLLLVDLVGRR